METPLPKQRNGRIVAVSQQKAASAKTRPQLASVKPARDAAENSHRGYRRAGKRDHVWELNLLWKHLLPNQRNGRIVAISNQKGGSAKTMTAINLGEACARVKYKVLIVDLDGQGNATTSLGVKAEDLPQDGRCSTYSWGSRSISGR